MLFQKLGRRSTQKILNVAENTKMLIDRGNQASLKVVLSFLKGPALRRKIKVLTVREPGTFAFDNQHTQIAKSNHTD